MRNVWIFGSVAVVLVAACSAGSKSHLGGGGSGAGLGTGGGITIPTLTVDPTTGNSGGVDEVVTKGCTSACNDFSATPVIDPADTGVPTNAATLFGAANPAATGLCVAEPQDGALVPANWVRMRFRVQPANNENLFEIRISSPTQANPLVAYTSNTTWAIPKAIWEAMGVKGNAIDVPISVTIRGVNKASPGTPSGGTVSFTIAPVTAGGSMVYWATTSPDIGATSSKLVGFHVGEETVVDALTIPQVQQSAILQEGGSLRPAAFGISAGRVRCIGCHTSTPDGTAVGFTDHYPWNNVISSVDADAGAGVVPSWFSVGAQHLLNQPWLGMMTFSKAHWTGGDRVALTSYGAPAQIGFNSTYPNPSLDRLAWFDVETAATLDWVSGDSSRLNTAITGAKGTAWDFLPMTGSTKAAVTPSWSHDGNTIVYTSAGGGRDGRIADNVETDIYTVPYNNKQGGAVAPVAGAATTGVSEYYPSFSADDTLIAYTRAGSTTGMIYYRPDGEVYVIDAAGGTPERLLANDPPSCTGEKSPGVINSWPKWSPTAVSDPASGKTYYWLIFSSARKFVGQTKLTPNQYSPPDTRTSQLYMTGIVKDGAGKLTTYPAVYVWNQGRHADGTVDATTTNLTPAWDQFTIPPAPPPH